MKFALGVAPLILGFTFAAQAAEPAKWSVPVRVFSSDAPASDTASTETTPPPETISSAGLPPQYETRGRNHVVGAPQPDPATLRFIVSLVERPILVEARVTVDGKPFRSLREERIDGLLQELAAVKLEPDDAPDTEPGIATDRQPVEAAAESDAVRESESDSPSSSPVSNAIAARLRRYAQATKRAPTRDEVRWLLTNWASGPTLLLLDENYQRVRAQASPMFGILDRDEDGVLSTAEIASAEQSLWKYDSNQDEVLSFSEINKAAERSPDSTEEPPAIPPLLTLDQLAHSPMWRRVGEYYASPLPRFDQDSDGLLSETEVAALQTAEPELILSVAFDTQDASRSRVEIVAQDSSIGDAEPTKRETSLTLLVGGTLLELSAVQAERGPATDQISLGALRDGFPLLPEMDVNEDGRLTVRELWQVSMSLATFDRDQDGSVSKAELLPMLRVSFGHGPIVHRHLATVRSVHPELPAANIIPPEWFARMDGNRDGDLTRREFLGGKDQFVSLDADQDGLISIAEASGGDE